MSSRVEEFLAAETERVNEILARNAVRLADQDRQLGELAASQDELRQAISRQADLMAIKDRLIAGLESQLDDARRYIRELER